METVDLSLLSEEDGIVKFQNILQNHAYNKHKIELCVAFERVPSEMYFQRIIDLLFIYKSCYLKMIKYIKEKSVQMEKIAIHAGEEVCISSRKIILGDVNVGGHLLVNANVVVIGSVKGKVTLLSDDASIFASKFENAKIYTPFGIMKEITGINQLISQEDLGNKIWHE